MKGERLAIQLVEDNEDHAEIVFRTFKNHRIKNQLNHLSDGAEALDYLYGRKQYSERNKYPLPSLILLDLRLPKIDGIEVLTTIKRDENLKRIPVVILTSSDAEIDIVKAYDNYANSYIVKPLEFDNFTKLMDDLGYYWLIWNENI